ncbi:epsin-3-like isoform X1 [Oncorhynchus tshawytscha]|uniref:ENTH domain-containing protein n=1 Tax=Oncorhynchus tshawytscha TaxID=74940 RepID=A0AAZ3NWR9_ONCTS|nr:epsin-3-like isoform X1 [Oncorhynchus tshawytscha]
MTTSALRRQVKNIVHNYSEAEIKVREATSNDPWGPSSSLMSEIADLTFNVVAFAEVMGMVWKRLNDHGKNWRHVYKALTLLDYLIKTGSERVAQQCRENAFTIQTLRDFQYMDRDGRDQGGNVREKARQLVSLLRDEERLRQERSQALTTKERMTAGTGGGGGGTGGGGGGTGHGVVPPAYQPGRRTSQPNMAAHYGEEFIRSRGSPSSFNSSSSSPREASDLEQARPQTSGEEELQLQLALAMSREESEKLAPPPPIAMETDDTQLQIALSLSKEEHEQCLHGNCVDDVTLPPLQDQRCLQGDESFLQRALDENRMDSHTGTGESTMLNLVDIFGPSEAPPPTDDLWDAQPAVTSDPWDSVAVHSNTAVIGSPWKTRPSSSSPTNPWAPSRSPTWEAPPTSSSSPVNHGWESPPPLTGDGTDRTDPFSVREEEGCKGEEGPPQTGSPTGPDLFGERVLSPEVNGRGEGSPEMFDLSRLAPPQGYTAPRMCRTPEAFLGPTGASLVNLDALIPPNPPSRTHNNPFLLGLSVPSPTNPFHCDQPRLTLNQMLRPCSTSPLPPHTLPYSPSLPLPLPHHTQASPGLLDLPSNLPHPLLPLSPAPAHRVLPQSHTHSHNPFL